MATENLEKYLTLALLNFFISLNQIWLQEKYEIKTYFLKCYISG
jgi:hypothetical protein